VYLDDLPGGAHQAGADLIKHSFVRDVLRQHGYRIAAFPTGLYWTELTDADIYYEGVPGTETLNNFEALILEPMMLRMPLDLSKGRMSRALHLAEERRIHTLNGLEALRSFPEEQDKLFAFAHFIIPHDPYDFGPNGEDLTHRPDGLPRAEERKAYADQARFISREILEVIDVILAKSDPPPIMIIMGDHGPSSSLVTPAERMQNLSAYLLPGVEAAKVLYPSITPVNSFRAVLNEYFDEKFPLLEHHSYYTPDHDLGQVREIPPSCPENP
jgi:hypothetical protein